MDLSKVKQYLKITSGSQEDDLLASLISAAEADLAASGIRPVDPDDYEGPEKERAVRYMASYELAIMQSVATTYAVRESVGKDVEPTPGFVSRILQLQVEHAALTGGEADE